MDSNFYQDIALQLRAGSQNLLSNQESIVAAYLIMDYNTNEIAIKLCRAITTIKTQIISIKRKCSCKTHIKLGSILHGFLKNHPEDYIQINRSGAYFIGQTLKQG